jgi:hypothetical protein
MTDLMVSSLTDEGGNSELTYELIGVRLMAQATTSSVHRERVLHEERLNTVKQEPETAEKDFNQFSSKNATVASVYRGEQWSREQSCSRVI